MIEEDQGEAPELMDVYGNVLAYVSGVISRKIVKATPTVLLITMFMPMIYYVLHLV